MKYNWLSIFAISVMLAVGCPGQPDSGEARQQLTEGLQIAESGADTVDDALT
jgi:hypothetical protein